MLLLPIYFILGLLSTVYSAPWAAISNQGAPHLQTRAGPAVILVDVKFDHLSSESYTWEDPPIEVQRRVALALFGDSTKEQILAIRWTNTYQESDGSFQWRKHSSTNTYQSDYSDKIVIPATEDPGKSPICVDFGYLKTHKEKPFKGNPKNTFDLLQEQARLKKESKGK
ncbi:hypothetical protein F5876DRAFT_69427 [Lentinula aff. lateritia]|uniref:Uncharacterized protein n=1 Tax=Lentinula aff. lateritia TaxID=2804960 RepID=A0ACC1TMQ0_9AGAR|nr:hypothetical protein F5876DRAFT_69427 [Lentinula aff. lateritia]